MVRSIDPQLCDLFSGLEMKDRMPLSNIMWVEKYRPAKLTEVIDQEEIVGSLNSLLKNQLEMPHLLFSGSAGVGAETRRLF